jgi:murein DD-endopeptidase MepM/ murein hydrolase activator NlpD
MNRRDIKLITAYWGDGRNHKGIDFAGNTGSPLFAAKAGKVSFAGWDGAYGYAVVVDHGNGYQTRYAHANALCVSKGDTVKQGQQVATLGNTGRSTGPHLHFEILKNGKQYNASPYLGLKH